MNREHCAKTFDELWPGSDWTALIVREFWRRVERFNLTDEQVEAVLHEYRMTTRYKSPVPADLLNRLRVAAFPDKGPRVRDEEEPTPPPGGWLTRGAWQARASDLIAKQVASACDCPRFEGRVGWGPNGSDGICRRCGGSFAGKALKYGGGIGA